MATPALRFYLASVGPHEPGQQVMVSFELRNGSTEAVWVLKWYTPLEGLKGRILRVRRDGTEIPYVGPMIKRGAPGREDYVLIPPSGRASSQFELSRFYDLSAPGDYRVEFVGRIHDVVPDGQPLPRPQEVQRAVDVPGDPLIIRISAH
jgi:hypothetical protein